MVRLMKDFAVHITDFRPVEEAIVTAGGVDVRQVSPKTMGSKLVENLYFAGEVLDVDGYTGGSICRSHFPQAPCAAKTCNSKRGIFL